MLRRKIKESSLEFRSGPLGREQRGCSGVFALKGKAKKKKDGYNLHQREGVSSSGYSSGIMGSIMRPRWCGRKKMMMMMMMSKDI